MQVRLGDGHRGRWSNTSRSSIAWGGGSRLWSRRERGLLGCRRRPEHKHWKTEFEVQRPNPRKDAAQILHTKGFAPYGCDIQKKLSKHDAETTLDELVSELDFDLRQHLGPLG